MVFAPLVAIALSVPVPPPGLVGRVGSPPFRAPVDCQLLGVSADGRRVYSSTASFSNTTRPALLVWDAATGRLVAAHPVGEPGDKVYEIILRPDGLRLPVARGGTRAVRTVDPDTGRTVATTAFTAYPPDVGERPFSRLQVSSFGAHGWVMREVGRDVYFRDAVGGTELRIRTGFDRPTKCFIRDDGAVVAVVPDAAHPIRLHDLPGGGVRLELPKPDGEQAFAAFTPDGRALGVFTKRADGWAFDLWDLASKANRTLFDKEELPGRVVFAPDGKTFARLPIRVGAYYPGGDWEVRSTADGRVISRVPSEPYSHAAAFSPDGKTLYLQTGSRTIVPWDTATGKPAATATDPPGEIGRFRFTADGRIVAQVAGGVSVFGPDGGKGLSRVRLPRTPDYFYGVRFNSAGERLTFVDSDRRLTTWEYRTGKETTHVVPPPGPNSAPTEAFTPDAAFQVSAVDSLTVRDVRSGETTTRPMPAEWRPRGQVWPLAVSQRAASPDGRFLALASILDRFQPDGRVVPFPSVLSVFDTRNATPPRSVVLTDFDFTSLTFSPDGRLLVAGGAWTGGGLRVFDAATLRTVATLPHTGVNANALAFSPDGRLVAISCAHHEVRLIETATWRERAILPSPVRVAPFGWSSDSHRDLIAFSPDGRRLATATPDGGLLVWDARKLGPKPERPASLDAAWADLEGEDARRAHAAIGVFAAFPDLSLPFLTAKLPPAVEPDANVIAARLALLDSDDFAEREAATKALAALGRHAEEPIRAALATTESAEVRKRLTGLLSRLPPEVPTADEWRAVRAVEAVVWAGTPAAKELLKAWAGGAPAARLTRDAAAALARLK